jgi:hypothetical protein
MKVTASPESPEQEQSLADCIRSVSQASQRLLKSGLNRTAIVVLLHDMSGLSKRDITTVLNNLESLATRYTK